MEILKRWLKQWLDNYEVKMINKDCDFCHRKSNCRMCGRCGNRKCNAGCIYCR